MALFWLAVRVAALLLCLAYSRTACTGHCVVYSICLNVHNQEQCGHLEHVVANLKSHCTAIYLHVSYSCCSLVSRFYSSVTFHDIPVCVCLTRLCPLKIYIFFSPIGWGYSSQWCILESRGTHKITFKFKSLQVYQPALSANTFPTSLIALSSADMQHSLTLGILWLESVPGKARLFFLSHTGTVRRWEKPLT